MLWSDRAQDPGRTQLQSVPDDKKYGTGYRSDAVGAHGSGIDGKLRSHLGLLDDGGGQGSGKAVGQKGRVGVEKGGLGVASGRFGVGRRHGKHRVDLVPVRGISRASPLAT